VKDNRWPICTAIRAKLGLSFDNMDQKPSSHDALNLFTVLKWRSANQIL